MFHYSSKPSPKRSGGFYLLALFLILMDTACSDPMKKPNIKQNPSPKMRYEMTVTVDGAPGPFDSIQASAGYDVANDRCVPLTPGIGATIAPQNSVPVPLTHLHGDVYRGAIYLDLLQDEDYYGLGVCHWKMTSVSIDLGIRQATMSSYLSEDAVLAQNSTTRYFSNRSYSSPDSNGVDEGNPKASDFEEEANQTFAVTLTAKEDFQ